MREEGDRVNDNHDGAAKKSAQFPSLYWLGVECAGDNYHEASALAYINPDIAGKTNVKVLWCEGAERDSPAFFVHRKIGRLLVSAPDLFAALEAIVAAPHGIAIGDLERAQAALAKARGPLVDACEGCQRTDVGTRLSADDVRLCEACFAECAAATKARGEVQP